jgi:hypothetical protein
VAGSALLWSSLQFSHQYSYPYDSLALLASAAGMLAILGRRTLPFLAIMALGAAGKETIAWLGPFWVLAAWGEGRLRALAVGAGGTLLALLVAMGPGLLREAEPGARSLLDQMLYSETGLFRPGENLGLLLLQRNAQPFQNLYWALAIHLPAIILVRRLPRDLQAGYAAAALLAVPLFLFGTVYETRIFGELVPLAAVSLAALAPALLHSPAKQATAPPQED